MSRVPSEPGGKLRVTPLHPGHGLVVLGGAECLHKGQDENDHFTLATRRGSRGAIVACLAPSDRRHGTPCNYSHWLTATRPAEQSLFRAAVIQAWTGAIALLQDYVFANRLADFNTEAARRDPKWKTAKTADDLGNMKESAFLDVLCSISVIGMNVKQDLEGCLKLRNGCGHPNTLKVGANKVAAHIETLVLNVYQKFS